MKIHLINILTIIFFFISCSDKNKVQYISIEPEIITDSIFTRMPGDLLLSDNHIAWSDPFSNDIFLHLIDLQTKKEIITLGNKGMGPKEFITPRVSNIVRKNQFYVFDLNSPREAYFSIDSVLKGKDYYIPINKEDSPPGTQLDSLTYINNTSDSQYYFELIYHNEISYFGNYPISNLNMHFGGDIVYDPIKEYLIFATWDFPYLALYQKSGNTFNLVWEKKTKVKYNKVDDGIILDNKIKGAKGLAMTKNYIVTIERDNKIDNTDENTVGMDFSKNSQTVFLYDYESNHVKTVNLGMPIVRITANPTSNILYAIVVNPEFTLVKCQLP